jgi:hypothetical protein
VNVIKPYQKQVIVNKLIRASSSRWPTIVNAERTGLRTPKSPISERDEAF